jgi:hypothetical protein
MNCSQIVVRRIIVAAPRDEQAERTHESQPGLSTL